MLTPLSGTLISVYRQFKYLTPWKSSGKRYWVELRNEWSELRVEFENHSLERYAYLR